MRDPWERLKAIDQVLSEGPITDEMLNAQSDRDTIIEQAAESFTTHDRG